MRYDNIAEDVAKELDMPVETVKLIYKKLFMYMRGKLSNMDIRGTKSRKDFEKMKTSFNLQHLGKLYINYDIIEKLRDSDESIGDTTDV